MQEQEGGEADHRRGEGRGGGVPEVEGRGGGQSSGMRPFPLWRGEGRKGGPCLSGKNSSPSHPLPSFLSCPAP